MKRSLGIVLGLAAGAAVALGNFLVLGASAAACVPCLAWLVAAPLGLALMLIALLSRRQETTPAATPAPSPPADTAALRLLAVLQEEGRLVDFLQEDLSGYGDEQIGAAVRGIHEGCRKVLRSCVALEPVLSGREDEPVTVEAGFDPAAIRLTGNVSGAPPFRGVLRHGGWRTRSVTLPARGGHDDRVIAPAEVEIP
jgi:hypothetical protein